MNYLIIDTEQTYGDIGYIVLKDNEITKRRQLVIKNLWTLAPNNSGKRQKDLAYKSLSSKIFAMVDYDDAFNELTRVIKNEHIDILCTHNLAADRKVFNSWCSASGNSNKNPFTLVKTQLDSQELVKFLTADDKTYSLESFIREVGVTDFVQEHTGLADTELVAAIICSFPENVIPTWFLSNKIEYYKKWVKSDKTIIALLNQGHSSAQIVKDLYADKMATCQRYGASGQLLKNPTYSLNAAGYNFFRKECTKFTDMKASIRSLVRQHFFASQGDRILEDETHPQHKELANNLDQIKKSYEVLIQKKYAMATEKANSIISAANEKANSIIAAANVKATSAAQEAQKTIDNLHTEIQKYTEQRDIAAKEAQYQANDIIENAKAKSKRIHFNSWMDRLFWPLLGIIIVVIGIILVNITF